MEIVNKSTTVVSNPGAIFAPDDDLSLTEQHELVNFFGLNANNLNEKDVQKLKDINEFLEEKASDSISRLRLLSEIRSKLGAPRLGETPISKVHRYIFLLRQRGQMEKELSSLEDKHGL